MKLRPVPRSILDAFNEFDMQVMTPADVANPREAKVVRRDQRHIAASAPNGVGGTPGSEPESGGSKAADGSRVALSRRLVTS